MDNKIKILVVDDEKSVRITLREILIDAGYYTDAAADFEEALALLKNNDYQIVISDIMMPEHSGLELLDMIKDVSPETKVIMITGQPNINNIVIALRERAFDYLHKPVSRADLLQTIENASAKILEEEEKSEEYEKITARKNILELEISEKSKLLSESEKKYRLLTETTSDMIIFTDPNDTILYVNPATITTTGFNQNELLGNNINNIFRRTGIKSVSGKSFKKGISVIEIKNKSGNKIYLEINETPVVINNQHLGTFKIARDITKRKIAEEDLNKLINAVEHTNASILITDNQGFIEYTNPKFLEITGYTKKEVIGAKPSILKSGYQDESLYKNLWETISSGKEWRGEFLNKKKNGELFWEFASISPVLNENNEISNYISVKDDITEMKTLMQELIDAKNKAESADKIKTNFLAQMSHEIRTPINSLLGYIEMVKMEIYDSADDDMKFSFSGIENSTKRLIRTMDLILNMSELQTDSYEFLNRDFNFKEEIIDRVIFEFNNEIAEKKLKINFSSNKDKIYYKGDFYSIYQIVSNLISNAIIFTNQGEVNITLSQIEDKLIFKVADTGIGISEKFLHKIFEPFTQEDEGYTRKFEGTGLGLSVVKKYCELNNAEIKVDSKKNVGSTFTVIFK